MRVSRLLKKRGFTLVELMIVVAIIGVLAALAIYGVRRYLASSKTSEAKNTIGAISRGATQAYERERTEAEDLPEGTESTEAMHALCESAAPVPAGFVPAGKKYQPETDGDFEIGTSLNGWKCLKFGMSQPHYYQYHYYKNAGKVDTASAAACTADCYEAAAQGDLDGDTILSKFSRTGAINTTTKKLKASTQVYIEEEFE